MTTVAVSLVDVVVLRGRGESLEVLLLQRGPGGRCPGSWEMVHGHIEAGETPADAAQREVREETGVAPTRFYNLSRVELFYQHRVDEVAMVPVFVAFLPEDAEVVLSHEHAARQWCTPADARQRCAWAREARALDDAIRMLGSGDAGPIEDVLRLC
ncbi:MAG: NUDIX domain-containing protein [Gemmatimonadetes bacterium]|nr:NUDIX domain-containing protein [Gemmatimonadota bacterium]